MRASRQTELSARYTFADVCAWLGNSLAIAAKHYVRPTNRTFAEAAQNATQSGTDWGGQAPSDTTAEVKFPAVRETSSVIGIKQVLPVGLEPTTY